LAVTVILHGDLYIFLPRGKRCEGPFEKVLERRTSVKDFLEAHGVPHPEIYRITVNGEEKDFGYIVAENDRIEVMPFPSPVNLATDTLLRPPLKQVSFIVDVNVQKLAGLLRMAGFDALCDPDFDDSRLAEISGVENRILLTRDRALLKRKTVVHGRIIRSIVPVEQLREVVSLYGLAGEVKPFTRCLLCNENLVPVEKAEVIDRLEPLTIKYFDAFHICPKCGKLFWGGSHRDSMLEYLKGI